MIIKPIIAITGSAGKTMVKTMVASVLREKWVVFESKDYYNTVDKTQLHKEQITSVHRAVVLEYGMAFPGAITEHCSIIKPNMSVITNVGLAHIGNFNGDINLLAKAKSELISGMEQKGELFINADDPNSKLLLTNDFTGKIHYIGINNDSEYRAFNIEYKEKTVLDGIEYGISFDVNLHGNLHSFFIPVVGRHNVYNALFAIAIADQLGFEPTYISDGLLKLTKPNHRLNVIRLKDDIKVIDDTVHSHPPAVKAAIDVLCEISGKKRIAVLGTMPELGMNSLEYHEEIGKYIAERNVDYLYTYGGYSVNIGKGAIESGFSSERVNHKKVAHRKIMHDELTNIIEPGSTILVKGASRLDMFETVRFLCEYYGV